MTRRGFQILLALTLFLCGLCPFIEIALHWDQSIFQTGYDGESNVAIIALVLILAFALAKLVASFISEDTTEEPLFHPQGSVSLTADAAASFPDGSPPLALRI
jgi:hypothetical protein